MTFYYKDIKSCIFIYIKIDELQDELKMSFSLKPFLERFLYFS